MEVGKPLRAGELKDILLRNRESIAGPFSFRRGLFLEYWQREVNVGDALSPVIVSAMRDRLGLSDRPAKAYLRTHLLSVGSLIGMRRFDAVIWGSGIHCRDTAENVERHKGYVRYDVRIVRGPVTGKILRRAGYKVPGVYGDPAVLMPLIYEGRPSAVRHPVSLIPHLGKASGSLPTGVNVIDPRTADYRWFIDEILSSEKVVSSSLHGIILAEAYGVPAVFCGEGMENEMMKFADWYASTGRDAWPCAATFAEGIETKALAPPDLSAMRDDLMRTFPADLWRRKPGKSAGKGREMRA